MDWRDLLTALALYLVLEGIMPFLNPSGFKGFLGRLRDLDDAVLRRAGGFSMAAGVLLIYFVR
ncbi:MAG: DUF2065 domain-containing protein [Gammaproteobacteria bacterium]|nr:DUF2065 domain-containing protein [Gammaproteobacteria bacterium]MDD9884371.1 DUF2065 domain-containing protein [Gammaproteobacteria bacterium]